MTNRPAVDITPTWRVALRDRRLAILALTAAVLVTLAYQGAAPFAVPLGSRPHGALLEGFHAPESGPGGAFRWTSGSAHVRLPAIWPGRDVHVRLVLSAPRPAGDPGAAGVAVTALANGRPLAEWQVTAAPAEFVADIPSAYIGPSGDLDLSLLAPTFAPANDLRQLGLLVSLVELKPEPGLPAPPSTRALFGVTALVCLAYVWGRRLGAGWLGLALAAILLLAAVAGLLLVRPFVAPVVERLLFLGVVALVASEVVARLGGFGTLTGRRALAALFLGGFGLRLLIAHTPGDHDNFIAFRMMIENVTRNGIANAYAIDPIIGAYPPLHHYFLAITGLLYRAFVSPEMDMGSRRLEFLMKLPTITMDMVILATVIAYAGRHGSRRRALAIGAAYALNPGIIYTVAYNGQLGDPLYSGLLALAVVGVLAPAPALAGAATVLAALTKPQSAAFLPFLGLAMLRHFRARALGRAALAGGGAALLVLAPFAIAGTLPDMLRTVLTTVGHGPRIVSNALNIWWLWGWGDAWQIRDTELLFGLVPYRTVGLVLFFGLAYGLIAWKTWRTRSRSDLAQASVAALSLLAAFTGFCFFMLPTEIHENYLFPTIPLLAIAAVHDRRAVALYVVLSLTWFLNMASYDQTLMRPLLAAAPSLASTVFPLQVVLALVNLAVLLVWAWWVWRGRGNSTQMPATLPPGIADGG